VAWRFEHTAESTADPDAVWSRYVDVEHWCEWSPAIEWSRLDGQFRVGAKGKSKARGAPAGRFRLVRVEPNVAFASTTWLPGAGLMFEHLIEPHDAGLRITHRATLSGPLSPLYTRRIRSLTEQSLTEGVDRLAVMAAGPN
jgi:hypothetical protein